MTRDQLEHIIRAAGTIADDDAVVVIGSQAILGQFPDAPASLLVSMEADVYPRTHPDRADLVDGSIGEGSPFHQTFGYYAQGVGPETAVLPSGWSERLVAVANANTAGVTGWCLEVHDLLLSKYVAGREKDRLFIAEAIRHALVDRDRLLARLEGLPLPPDRIASLRLQVQADFT
jgi:hypothetical protein